MYCIRCGKQIKDGVKYCMYCGSPTAEGRKAQANPQQNTASIPTDFFSRRMKAEPEDDFTIAIPKDFIQNTSEASAQMPDPAGEIEYTRMISRQDIQNAIEETQEITGELIPDGLQDDIQKAIVEKIAAQGTSEVPEAQEIENKEYTRVVSKDNIDAALAELHSEPEQEISDAEQTQAFSRQEIHEAVKQEAEQAPQESELAETRVMDKGEIKSAAKHEAEPIPEDTRVVDKEQIKAAAKQEAMEAAAAPEYEMEATPDDIESVEYTRAMSKTEILEAKKAIHKEEETADVPAEQEMTDITKIPDIPIPDDFVAPEPLEDSQQVYPNPDAAYRRNQIKRREKLGRQAYQEEDEDDGPEQLVSGRGMVMVAIVVILLFAIAVGAVVMALRGGEPEDTGSGNSEISFSYGESDQ
ncbi:MAG: zinc ribbon domain-containing protein [Clostridia bacterium]|nr:zinc ribbon domain-containing protein [Clostridia bacterium]